MCERERECGHKDNKKESHSKSAEGRDPFHTNHNQITRERECVCVCERERDMVIKTTRKRVILILQRVETPFIPP